MCSCMIGVMLVCVIGIYVDVCVCASVHVFTFLIPRGMYDIYIRASRHAYMSVFLHFGNDVHITPAFSQGDDFTSI